MIRIIIQPKTGLIKDRAEWTRKNLKYARLAMTSLHYPSGKNYFEEWEFFTLEDAIQFKLVWG